MLKRQNPRVTGRDQKCRKFVWEPKLCNRPCGQFSPLDALGFGDLSPNPLRDSPPRIWVHVSGRGLAEGTRTDGATW